MTKVPRGFMSLLKHDIVAHYYLKGILILHHLEQMQSNERINTVLLLVIIGQMESMPLHQ